MACVNVNPEDVVDESVRWKCALCRFDEDSTRRSEVTESRSKRPRRGGGGGEGGGIEAML